MKGMEILVRTDDMIASMFCTADPMSDTVVLNSVARSMPCAFGGRIGLCQCRSSSGMCGSKGSGKSQEDEVQREESVRDLSLHTDCTKRIG